MWELVLPRADVHSLSVLARKDIKLCQDAKQSEYFCCHVTGNGPYKRLGRLVKDKRRTRIFYNHDVSTSELAYLTTALARAELSNWAEMETIDYGYYPNGEPYKRIYVSRTINDDDLSLEAFETIELNAPKALPTVHPQERTPFVPGRPSKGRYAPTVRDFGW